MELLRLFSDNLLPVFLTAGAGYALAATIRPDPRAISHVAFWVFAPCLLYQVIVDSHVPPAALLRIMAFAATVLLGVAAIAFGLLRLTAWPRTMVSAVLLVVLLPNAGNFGLSASLFAFGDQALTHASLFFLSSSLLTYTIGVLIASAGRSDPRSAVLGLVRVPAIWAAALAFAAVGSGGALPLPAARSVKLLADACIPTFLIILGMQLHGAGLRAPVRPVAMAVGLRLLGGAAAGLLLAPLFGLAGPARQAGVLQAAMPSAVICTILATEYDVEPGFVTAVVFWSTLLSPLTLTPLIAWLQR